MPNIVTTSDCTHGDNKSRAAMICPDDGILMIKQYDLNEFYILGNLLACEGKQGPVSQGDGIVELYEVAKMGRSGWVFYRH